MASTTFYVLEYWASVDKPWIAHINCYDQPSGEAGGSRIGSIRFFADPTTVPPSDNENGVPIVNFPLARFADVVAILRSETDISVNFFSGGPDNARGWGISSASVTAGLRER